MRLFFIITISAVFLFLSVIPFTFGWNIHPYIPQPLSQTFKTAVSRVIPSPPPLIDSITLTNLINTLRQSNGLNSLSQGSKTCLMANSALFNQQLDPQIISQKCPECRSLQVARFSQPLNLTWLQNQIITDASISAYILNPQLTHICVATDSSQVVVALVSAQSAPPPTAFPVTNFNEDQLWHALLIYRQSQGRSSLQRDENLCRYARKRVQDHLQLFSQHLDPSQYPIPDKYPLDAHQGFKHDGDSGLLFEITQKTQVAENLAYWPNAQDPIHVIEWGWDTSTEGHREAQLSNDWNSACLSSQDGFYVAIFGR